MKTANPFTFANTIRPTGFRAGTLSYISVQVQSPIHSRQGIYFFIRWMNQTADWFTELAKHASNE